MPTAMVNLICRNVGRRVGLQVPLNEVPEFILEEGSDLTRMQRLVSQMAATSGGGGCHVAHRGLCERLHAQQRVEERHRRFVRARFVLLHLGWSYVAIRA
jgi:hypothetical protein